MNKRSFLIGCVADDFTGASDAGSFLAENGIRCVLVNGIPSKTVLIEDDIQAVIIALKSRTQQRSQAVSYCLNAFQWLKEHGAQQLYFKYCSTFDSTPNGNIGPVIDAVLERYEFPMTVICPSLLENGRTVKNGILYVNNTPLAQSHMRHHPLTPMWDSKIINLLSKQGTYACFNLTYEDYSHSLEAWMQQTKQEHPHFYVCPDYNQKNQEPALAKAFGNLPFLTGGSGLLGVLAKYQYPSNSKKRYRKLSKSNKPRLLLAGSCSVATQSQVKAFIAQGEISMMVGSDLFDNEQDGFEKLLAFMRKHQTEDVLFYSAGSLGHVEPSNSDKNISVLFEQTFSKLAVMGIKEGYENLIVGGGETSGAVTQALNFSAFTIGSSVAPGVPILCPIEQPNLQIVLKSGNFGNELFFCNALKEASNENN